MSSSTWPAGTPPRPLRRREERRAVEATEPDERQRTGSFGDRHLARDLADERPTRDAHAGRVARRSVEEAVAADVAVPVEHPGLGAAAFPGAGDDPIGLAVGARNGGDVDAAQEAGVVGHE